MTNETKLVNFRRPTTDQFSVAVDMIDDFHPAGNCRRARAIFIRRLGANLPPLPAPVSPNMGSPLPMRFPGLSVDGQRRVGGDEVLVAQFVPEVVGDLGVERRVVFCDALGLAGPG